MLFMNKQKTKLSLYIKVENIDGAVDFDVLPATNDCVLLDDNIFKYSWEYDSSTVFVISVVVNSITGTKSNVQIKQLTGNEIDISNLNKCSIYKRFCDNEIIQDSYGYMAWPGEYKIKLRYSPMIHRYITNFLEQSKKNSK